MKLQLVVDINWINFGIYEYINLLSYTQFIIGNYYFQLVFTKGQSNLYVKKMINNYETLKDESELKKYVQQIKLITFAFLNKLFKISYSPYDQKKMTHNYNVNIKIIIENKSEGKKTFNQLNDYFLYIETSINKLTLKRESVIPFISTFR